jgi:tetratricopeptide (TPR) repeat protein
MRLQGDSMKHGFLIIIILALSFCSCQTGKPIKRLSNEGFLHAMIYDHENTPVNNVTIYINGKKTVESDIQGRFVLESMKKGQHSIKLTKKGYEDLIGTFQYEPMNVLYFKMINTQQLTVLAENAIDLAEYAEAEGYINRILAIEPNRQDILYLKSINYYLQRKYQEALVILEEQIRQGNHDPSIAKLIEKIRQTEADTLNADFTP